MAKSSRPGWRGKSGPISDASRKVKSAGGLSKNDLCGLCALCGSILFFIPVRIGRLI
jgi:hypothetical protein